MTVQGGRREAAAERGATVEAKSKTVITIESVMVMAGPRARVLGWSLQDSERVGLEGMLPWPQLGKVLSLRRKAVGSTRPGIGTGIATETLVQVVMAPSVPGRASMA